MTSATATPTALTQYCTFWADGQYFGVNVCDVQEVLRFHEMTHVPQAHEAITGLINLRGQIVTAIDLRHRLGLAPRPEGETPMNVVVRSRDEVVSLLVDDIGDVIDTEGAAVMPVPATVPPAVRDVLVGVIPRPEAILLVLHADLAADVSTHTRISGGNS
ncbi:MAG TPA: chemotaxis protein CheW [Acidimicrobiales bacterium]|nr:chemotaxis protein CheW [Acidimicrobiales bacterium]